jgi:hypothetical protein
LGNPSPITAARIVLCTSSLSLARQLQTPAEPFTLQDFAGSYYQSGGFEGGVLTLNADSGFSLSWAMDIGSPIVYTGTVTYGTPGTSRNEQRPLGMPDELIPVRWGQRRYLIAADELDFFCLWMHEGREPRHDQWNTFYLHDGDWNIPVIGNPTLYRGMLKFSLVEHWAIKA